MVFLGNLHVTDCHAERSGGGAVLHGLSIINGVAFLRNVAGRGGAIENTSYTTRIENSTFDGNSTLGDPSVGGEGGGIANISTRYFAGLLLRASTVSNNASGTSGGIINRGALPLVNSTVSGNSAPRGAGIAYESAIRTDGDEGIWVIHSTIARNNGRGIRNPVGRHLVFEHALLVANGADGVNDNCDSRPFSSRYSFDDGVSCGLTGVGDVSGLDPMLGPLADNGGPTRTHALIHCGPAIDAGAEHVGERLDQRGRPRPFGARADIGAYEAGLNPALLGILVPIRWNIVFATALSGQPTAYSTSLALFAAGNDKTGDAPIVGIKGPADEGLVQFELGKDGRTVRVSGLAIPPKQGTAIDKEGPILFYVDVQRPVHGASQLRITDATCGCGSKVAKPGHVVIPPYTPQE